MAALLVSYATKREVLIHAIDNINIPETHTQGMERVEKEEAMDAYRPPFNRERTVHKSIIMRVYFSNIIF